MPQPYGTTTYPQQQPYVEATNDSQASFQRPVSLGYSYPVADGGGQEHIISSDVVSPGSTRDRYPTGRTSSNRPMGFLRCLSCKATQSPVWRKGPSGEKELCNACGLRYARSRAKKEGGQRRHKEKTRKKEAEGFRPVGAPARRGDNTRFNNPNMYDPACNGGSPSPNAQSNTSNDESNPYGMAKTFSNWSSPMAANKNCSTPGSSQSRSSSVSDFSQSSLAFPSPPYNRGSSSPSGLSNTSHSGSNSKRMAERFSNWSDRPSPRATNEHCSRPGSAQSGSSGGRSDSP